MALMNLPSPCPKKMHSFKQKKHEMLILLIKSEPKNATKKTRNIKYLLKQIALKLDIDCFLLYVFFF